ncbi:MAG: hypothetical protein ACYTG5_07855 [Planctomycetota bacterium]|jgi:hypothetical protein
MPDKQRRWPSFLLLILIGHVLWGAVRIPSRVYERRLDKIGEYLDRGPALYHLDNDHRKGGDIIEKLLAETSEDCVILWRGNWKGVVEFIPFLIAPRLLVEAGRVPAGADQYLDRPIARGALASGETGVYVIVGLGESLELELR